ncbi:uncharacterized protein LOC111385026 [Olea europaea var. sylvestris]|uniref:uncharacterized protein LOC111385026 n=1 Tax=Olea europaea var. sylvestris TaxID=158386 RepID=UPI000C1D57CC|nr:uncharacterized protein LOC111385026 [Olea europaea var. sylvestris]
MLKPPMPGYTEVVSQGYEQRVRWHEPQHLAFYGQRQRNQQGNNDHFSGHKGSSNRSSGYEFTSQGRGFQPANTNFTGGQNEKHKSVNIEGTHFRQMMPVERERYHKEKCQIYDKLGHIASICWYKDKHFHPKEIPHALVVLTLDTSIQDTECTTDTGASNHIMGNSKLLFNLRSYLGTNSVLIGNGDALSIKGGNTLIKNGKEKLMLLDVLLIPSLARNLLSVSQH